jgi:aspartyl-tRNA(Asn)/glutamyl-tRNA(Gln) amidotransferase subunit C
MFNPTHKGDRSVPEEITREIFDHLVDLAALEMDEEEADYLRNELNNQLDAIHELEAIEFDPSTPVTSHGVPYTEAISAALREDRIEPCKEADEIVDQAPEERDRYIVVPDIPAEELE